jgi:hypothetical protein
VDTGIDRAGRAGLAREGADVVLSYLTSEESDAGETARLVVPAIDPSATPPGREIAVAAEWARSHQLIRSMNIAG